MELAISTLSTVPVGSTFSCPTCWQLSRMAGVKLGPTGDLLVHCASCGASIAASAQVLAAQFCAPVARSGAVASRRPRDPFSAPKDTCPECLAPHPERDRVCAHCNLDFDLFRGPTVRPSEKLKAAWREVVLRWADSTRHDDLQRLAVDLDELTGAYRLYSLWLAYLPRDPWALKGQEELAMLSKIAAEAKKPKVAPLGLAPRVLVGLASLGLVLFGTLFVSLI